MWWIMAARVVDLPDPVGPVTRTNPRGLSATAMQTLEDALNDLVARNEISYETAVAKANISTLIKKAGTLLDRD
jgi:hypothetical protein